MSAAKRHPLGLGRVTTEERSKFNAPAVADPSPSPLFEYECERAQPRVSTEILSGRDRDATGTVAGVATRRDSENLQFGCYRRRVTKGLYTSCLEATDGNVPHLFANKLGLNCLVSSLVGLGLRSHEQGWRSTIQE
jgi:hypothetical protein